MIQEKIIANQNRKSVVTNDAIIFSYLELANIYTEGDYYYLAISTLEPLLKFNVWHKKELISHLSYLYKEKKQWDKLYELYVKIFNFDKEYAYQGIRDLLSKAYNNNKIELKNNILTFYEKKGLIDSLYQFVKENE